MEPSVDSKSITVDLRELWTEVRGYLKDPPRGVALPFWPEFTRMLRGLRPRELTLFCAPTGSGKTQFLANLSAQVALQGIGQFVAPVETGARDYLLRILGAIDGKDYKKLMPLSEQELVKMDRRVRDMLLNSPIHTSPYENRVDVDELILVLKYMRNQGVQIALLDNLNFFLKISTAQNERIEMDEAMHKFVILAKQIDMHIILVVHPRKTDGEGRVESEFDIKGSSTAVQEASNVILFNRPYRKDVESLERHWTDRDLVFKKIREYGEHVNKIVRFRFQDGVYVEERI